MRYGTARVYELSDFIRLSILNPSVVVNKYIVGPEQSCKAIFGADFRLEQVYGNYRKRDNRSVISCKFGRGLDGLDTDDIAAW